MKKVEVFIVQLLCIVLQWPVKHQISYPSINASRENCHVAIQSYIHHSYRHS